MGDRDGRDLWVVVPPLQSFTMVRRCFTLMGPHPLLPPTSSLVSPILAVNTGNT